MKDHTYKVDVLLSEIPDGEEVTELLSGIRDVLRKVLGNEGWGVINVRSDKKELKISGFLAVVELFWTRAGVLFPSEQFANEVKRLSGEVREVLANQLNMSFVRDDDLPPDEKMGKNAVIALEKLCEYLDSKDPRVGYREIAEKAG